MGSIAQLKTTRMLRIGTFILLASMNINVVLLCLNDFVKSITNLTLYALNLSSKHLLTIILYNY